MVCVLAEPTAYNLEMQTYTVYKPFPRAGSGSKLGWQDDDVTHFWGTYYCI